MKKSYNVNAGLVSERGLKFEEGLNLYVGR